jgi:hypothetical protein
MTAPVLGDRVAYAAAFLKNTGQFTGEAPFRRGVLVGFDEAMTRAAGKPFALVRWDDAEEPGLVLASNIARVGSPRYALNDL